MESNAAKVLTISIAAYNVEKTLGSTLASVEADDQTMDALDIVVVDDGSADGTSAAARSFAERYPGSVRVIRKANGGYGSTVNTAVSCAKGDYFKLLDGDDTFDTQGLVRLVQYLKSCEADLVLTPYITERESAPFSLFRAGKKGTLTDAHSRLGREPVRLEDADLNAGLAMFEICVRTEVLRQSGKRLTENCFYTDNEFAMIAGLYAKTVSRFPEPVYRYRLGVAGQSMSVEGRRRHFDDKIRAAKGVLDMYRGGLEGGRKYLAQENVCTMIREVYAAAMLLDDKAASRRRLRDFEGYLDSLEPEIRTAADRSRLVREARGAGSVKYRLMSMIVTAREKRRTGRAVPVIAEYIAALCMIIQCRTIYMHLQDYGMVVNRVTWLILMAALAFSIAFYMTKRSLTDRKTWILCAALAVYAAVYIAVNPVNILRVIRCALTAAAMLILARTDEGPAVMRDIFRCFKNLMIVIGVLSLFGWFFGSTLHVLQGTGVVWIDWSSTGEYDMVPTLHWYYFETQQTWWNFFHARNSAIFVEAPMAGFCFATALLAELYICPCRRKRAHRVSAGFLIVCIVSTISATYWAFLLLMAAVYIALNMGKVRELPRAVKAAGGILLAAAAALSVRVLYVKLVWGSGSARLNDYYVGFRAWLNRPFFGGGWENLEYLQEFMPGWRAEEIGFSNSPFEILGQGGIYIGALYIYAFAAPLIRAVRRHDRNRILLIVFFAVLFSFTVIPYQYITFFFLIFICCDQGVSRNGEDARP